MQDISTPEEARRLLPLTDTQTVNRQEKRLQARQLEASQAISGS